MKKTKKYGNTPEESSILESAKCREILNEILNFGVSQNQMKVLIKLLSLELEDRALMLKIVDAVDHIGEQSINSSTLTV